MNIELHNAISRRLNFLGIEFILLPQGQLGGGIEKFAGVLSYILKGDLIGLIRDLYNNLKLSYTYYCQRRYFHSYLSVDLSIEVEIKHDNDSSTILEQQINNHKDICISLYTLLKDLQSEILKIFPGIRVSKSLRVKSTIFRSRVKFVMDWFSESELNESRLIDIIDSHQFNSAVSYTYRFRRLLWPLITKQ